MAVKILVDVADLEKILDRLKYTDAMMLDVDMADLCRRIKEAKRADEKDRHRGSGCLG